MQSPLFVRTDSELSSDTLSCDGFSDTSYDDDNASLESEDLSPVSIDSTLVSSRRNTRVHFSPQHAPKDGDGEEEPCSTNPFAKNYRKKADWDDETRKRMEREWFFVEDFIEKYESREHAEFTRPFDQFRVLISERGLRDRYERLFDEKRDPAERSCNIMNILLEEAPDLCGRYAELEQLTRERLEAVEEGAKAEWEVQWERRRRRELGPWGTPKIS